MTKPNTCTCEAHPYDVAVTDTPNKLRVLGDGGQWFIDGYCTHCTRYTEACWTYDTWQEAMDKVPDFYTITADYGVRWASND